MKTISKWITCVLILATFNFSFSQHLRDRIHGDWLCLNVTDSAGHKIASEFGEPDRYLRFSFQGKYLYIAQAPFDRGIIFPVHYGQDFIDPTFERLWDMPDMFYRVISLDSSKLILRTTSDKKQYLFINQNQFIPNPNIQKQSRDADILISQQWQSANYLIINIDKENFYPSPRFKDDRYANWGEYLSRYFALHFNFSPLAHSLSNTSPIDTLSYECMAEFEVTKKGLQNLKIIKGAHYEFNVAVFDAISLSRKNWHPVIFNDRYFPTRMRFKFTFVNLPNSDIFLH